MKFSGVFFQELGILKACFRLQMKEGSKPYQAPPWRVTCVSKSTPGRAGLTTEAANNSIPWCGSDV